MQSVCLNSSYVHPQDSQRLHPPAHYVLHQNLIHLSCGKWYNVECAVEGLIRFLGSEAVSEAEVLEVKRNHYNHAKASIMQCTAQCIVSYLGFYLEIPSLTNTNYGK